MVRFKNRYMLVELVFEDGRMSEALSAAHVTQAVRASIKVCHGGYGAACMLQAFSGAYTCTW